MTDEEIKTYIKNKYGDAYSLDDLKHFYAFLARLLYNADKWTINDDIMESFIIGGLYGIKWIGHNLIKYYGEDAPSLCVVIDGLLVDGQRTSDITALCDKLEKDAYKFGWISDESEI